MQAVSVAPTPGVFLPKPTTQGSGKGSGWTTIPEKLRSKIFCLAAGDKKADLAAFSRVSRQWRGDAGPLLNLARLHLFASALASVQKPPDSVPMQEASRRIALSLQNPDADHQKAFTNEWLAMTKIPALGQASPEVFQKFRFLDLNECIKIEAQGYKYGHEWLCLGELYLKAGACDKAQEVVLRMDPKLCYYLIPTLVSDIFIKLIGSDSQQWERGMKYVAELPFEQHLIQTVYVLLFQEFIKTRKLPQAVEILQLLEENRIDKHWQLFLAELLIEAGREDLLTTVLLKLKGSFYPHQLKYVFIRWTEPHRLEKQLLFPDKEIQSLTDHFKEICARNDHPRGPESLLHWANVLIDLCQYTMAFDILINCKCEGIYYDISDQKRDTLNKLAARLKCDSKSGDSFQQLLDQVESAWKLEFPTVIS